MSLVQGLPFHITVTSCVITTCHLDPFDLQDGKGGGHEGHETTADGQHGGEGAAHCRINVHPQTDAQQGQETWGQKK